MTWEMLWAVGRYDLRLTDQEFWSMVPRQFVALLARKKEENLRHEYGPALIVAAILGRGVKRPPDPRKFMPSYTKPVEHEMPWQRKMVELRAMLDGVGSR